MTVYASGVVISSRLSTLICETEIVGGDRSVLGRGLVARGSGSAAELAPWTEALDKSGDPSFALLRSRINLRLPFPSEFLRLRSVQVFR